MADIPATGDDDLQELIKQRFQCARCGYCCKGDGIVQFSMTEADGMARALGIKRQQFLKEFAVKLDAHEWILRDRIVPGPGGVFGCEKWCVFLECHPDGRYACRLGDAKPRQCHDFPYDWTNPTSFQTCVGLRVLMAERRREAAAKED